MPGEPLRPSHPLPLHPAPLPSTPHPHPAPPGSGGALGPHRTHGEASLPFCAPPSSLPFHAEVPAPHPPPLPSAASTPARSALLARPSPAPPRTTHARPTGMHRAPHRAPRTRLSLGRRRHLGACGRHGVVGAGGRAAVPGRRPGRPRAAPAGPQGPARPGARAGLHARARGPDPGRGPALREGQYPGPGRGSPVRCPRTDAGLSGFLPGRPRTFSTYRLSADCQCWGSGAGRSREVLSREPAGRAWPAPLNPRQLFFVLCPRLNRELVYIHATCTPLPNTHTRAHTHLTM